ncbi:HPP family protein [Ochrobactrum sp. Q0168]|uniref:HPP family protein n=1 Tax=Ochrobactrum sp. Q0168 TaxID=2793241 RepID=UPI0018EBCDAF|nr:HPP family protein [Ochrobactrum sp. Q0168]
MTRHKSPDHKGSPASRFRLFNPLLAGATLRERAIACVGALIGIAVTGFASGLLLGNGSHLPLIVAPIGASAVLLFAVPNSPLAQPWSIIGGNTISALVGVIVARYVSDPALAIGLGVALAIAAMSVTRSLHPPGGAAALTAVLGGQAVASWGLWFPLVPVCFNSCLLVGLGILFHRLSRRKYPHSAAAVPVSLHETKDLPPSVRTGIREEDIDEALNTLDESFDIDRNDLGRLLRQVELQASIRAHGDLTCADIMSRDVISIGENDTADQARNLLLRHRILTLPVTGADGRLTGMVGLRELIQPGESVKDHVIPAITAGPDDAALSLLPVLTDGLTHVAVIVDENRFVVGVVSKSDLLSAIARVLPQAAPVSIRAAA